MFLLSGVWNNVITDGKLLLTVPGFGLVSAAELYNEIGDVAQYDYPGQIIKKAGTNPIMKQSGGGQGLWPYIKAGKPPSSLYNL